MVPGKSAAMAQDDARVLTLARLKVCMHVSSVVLVRLLTLSSADTIFDAGVVSADTTSEGRHVCDAEPCASKFAGSGGTGSSLPYAERMRTIQHHGSLASMMPCDYRSWNVASKIRAGQVFLTHLKMQRNIESFNICCSRSCLRAQTPLQGTATQMHRF